MTPHEMPSGSSPNSARQWRELIDSSNLICRIAPGYEANLFRDSAQILMGEPHADMNFAFVGDAREAVRHLQVFAGYASKRSLPMMVLANEAAAPRLTEATRSLGFTPAGAVPLMVCAEPRYGGTSAPYVIDRIRDHAVLREATPHAARTFGLSLASVARVYNEDALAVAGVDYFVARRDSAIWSFVQTSRIGDAVGIWSMATPPEHQGKGAGRALLEAVLAYHRQRGAERFFLCASPAGQALYQRVGFSEAATLAAWLSGASSQLGASHGA